MPGLESPGYRRLCRFLGAGREPPFCSRGFPAPARNRPRPRTL